MTSRVTQCPKCQTSFRVTNAQLDIANGAVRCGSCLHIFNANDHWLGESPAADKPVAATELQLEPETPSSFSQSELLAEDDQAISDQLISDNILYDTTPENSAISSQPISDPANDDEHVLIDDNSPLINDDEARFSDDDQPNIVNEHTVDSDDLKLSESFLNLDQWHDSPASGFQESLEDEPNSEENWAERLLLEEDDQHTRAAPEFEEYDDLLSELEPAALEPDPPLTDILNKSQTISDQPAEEEFILGSEPMTAGERIGDNKQQLLANIEPEPVEITAQQKANRWKTIGWSSAIIASLLLLLLQFMYFNFDNLARDPEFRPLISSGCRLIRCAVPELHDIKRIQSSNLMVRSHPKASNALVVDAIITNRATFKQPFPILELRFTDMDNKIVAGRYFKPAEYLSGELSGSTIMPSQQPIHVALNIVDPGQQAVNYQLFLHQQKPQ